MIFNKLNEKTETVTIVKKEEEDDKNKNEEKEKWENYFENKDKEDLIQISKLIDSGMFYINFIRFTFKYLFKSKK